MARELSDRPSLGIDIQELPAGLDPQDSASFGEEPDGSSVQAIQLAHQAIKKFPAFASRHRKFIGSVAVISTSALVLAGIAIGRRLRRGESPKKILEEITPEEIENAAGILRKLKRRK
ncbi:MAG: hypothetical protein WEB00_06715 [Dehalococcoidia bacterium]